VTCRPFAAGLGVVYLGTAATEAVPRQRGGLDLVSKSRTLDTPETMGDEQESNRVGTSLDDEAEPAYEDGSTPESPPEPKPTEADSAIETGTPGP
jgi:hypothetical protein